VIQEEKYISFSSSLESLSQNKEKSVIQAPEARQTLRITLSGASGAKGKLLIEWENVTASVPFTVK
jgi:hypothetical protein